MVKKNYYFTSFIFFCSLTLLVCGEKNILPNLTNSQEPKPVFIWPLGAGAPRKKTRSRSRLKKSQEPEPLKNLPAPQPWYILVYIISRYLNFRREEVGTGAERNMNKKIFNIYF